MQVILCAYACNPYLGSEEGVGWNWVKSIAKITNPFVITASFHREDIEHYLKEHPDTLSNVSFVYVRRKGWHFRPTPAWKRIENSLAKPLMNLSYAGWLRDAYKLASQLHAEHSPKLVHQLTYVGYRFPGRLWKLGIPFVWGPLGGLENTPWRFLPVLGLRGAVYYGARNLVNSAQRLILRSPRKALAAAGPGVIAATSGIQRQLLRAYGVDSQVICEVGPPNTDHICPTARDKDESLRIVWSGEHLPGKALPLLLKALARLDNSIDWQLDVLGDGPQSNQWQSLSSDEGLGSRCHWRGRLERDEALNVMLQGHLFVITSMKDLTSTVLLEALSLGLPVICPDHCGFRDVVTEDCGIKLDMKTPQQLINDMAVSIEHLAKNEERRQALARGAVVRARDFSWEMKARMIEEVYRSVLDSSGEIG